MTEYSRLRMKSQELIQWILGPGQELLELDFVLGLDFQHSDRLQMNQDETELKCIGLFSQYGQLRYSIDFNIQNNHPVASAMQEIKEELDMVYCSFAHQLEYRRIILKSLVLFQRAVQKAGKKFQNMNEFLKDLLDEKFQQRNEQNFHLLHQYLEEFTALVKSAIDEGKHLLIELVQPNEQKPCLGDGRFLHISSIITYIKAVVAKLEKQKNQAIEVVGNCQEHLNHIYQIQICEKTVTQAVQWIIGMNDCMTMNCDALDNDIKKCNSEECPLVQGRIKEIYDYGKKLLEEAKALRLICNLPLDRNDRLNQQLAQAWQSFLIDNLERTKLTINRCKHDYNFLYKVNKQSVVPSVCNIRYKMDEPMHIPNTFVYADSMTYSPCRLSYLAKAEKMEEKTKKSVESKMMEARSYTNGQSVETRTSLTEVSRRDSLRSTASTSSSIIMSSFKSAASSLVDEWKTATASSVDDWKSVRSDVTSGDEWKTGDEYFSAEETLSDNGKVLQPQTAIIHEPTAGGQSFQLYQSSMMESKKSVSKSTVFDGKVVESSLKGASKFEKVQAVSDSSSTRVLRESASSSIDSVQSPLMTSTPMPVSGDSSVDVVDTDPILQNITEVGKNMCDMIDVILLK